MRRKTTAKAELISAQHGVPAQSCLVPAPKQSPGSGPCTLGQAEACWGRQGGVARKESPGDGRRAEQWGGGHFLLFPLPSPTQQE